MNVLILNGSTRKKGNTNNSVKLIKDLLAKRGHTYTEINDNVIGCINCAQCIYDGKCHIEDSFSSDVQQNFDWILIVSPIYFFGISGKSKNMLDRLYHLNKENIILSSITFSGSDTEESGGFDIIWEQLRRICDFCDMNLGYSVNFCTYDEIIEQKDIIKEIENIIVDTEVLYNEIKKDNNK